VVKEYKGTAELGLIGDGPERAMLEQLVDTVGMKQRISFLGYQENPAPFFSGTSLFVLPSLSEGQGVALMEAMLTSTPCIITSVGGAPEFIEDKVNGWLMDPYDLPAFARMLREIMAMPERDRQQVAERGRQVVLDRFMPGRYMMSIYQLYHGKN
jgi:glycosyltransferase involved in cell wall biosynthesis